MSTSRSIFFFSILILLSSSPVLNAMNTEEPTKGKIKKSRPAKKTEEKKDCPHVKEQSLSESPVVARSASPAPSAVPASTSASTGAIATTKEEPKHITAKSSAVAEVSSSPEAKIMIQETPSFGWTTTHTENALYYLTKSTFDPKYTEAIKIERSKGIGDQKRRIDTVRNPNSIPEVAITLAQKLVTKTPLTDDEAKHKIPHLEDAIDKARTIVRLTTRPYDRVALLTERSQEFSVGFDGEALRDLYVLFSVQRSDLLRYLALTISYVSDKLTETQRSMSRIDTLLKSSDRTHAGYPVEVDFSDPRATFEKALASLTPHIKKSESTK